MHRRLAIILYDQSLRRIGGTALRRADYSFSDWKQKSVLSTPSVTRTRPTDLCATALFSFQGTNATAEPRPDWIVDHTEEARHWSHDEHHTAPIWGCQAGFFARFRRRLAFMRFPQTAISHQTPD